ncbi:GNAT family N-acetyltransferase [Deinococcus ficus]|uniref:GNAT family N-acetyltransferase n=1 Tax=Deinococcus ficus TaxID=317577 RepID=UPI000A04620F|nr:GNAT family N-acetyltransferase [Deinococcus ficus]
MLLDDTDKVQRIFADSFPLHLRRLMIYGQHGLSQYLGDILKYPSLFPAFKLYVFEDHRGLAYAEFRISDNRGFLSNIFVDSHLRGKGIGSQLIFHFMSEFPDVKSLQLDVFESNAGALRLYHNLGFKKQDARAWYTRPLPTPASARSSIDPRISELSTNSLISSIAMYERYGFTEHQTQSGISFGRIGETVLRCRAAEDAENPEIIHARNRHFPQISEAFCISSEPLPPPWQQIDLSWRMTMRSQALSRGEQ